MTNGKLIVIDGGDGAGKQTQTDMLVHHLIQDGYQTGTLDFPRYQQNFFGALLRECLDGKHGDFLSIDPKIASTLYACDRLESKPLIEEWLGEGRIVVLDRYTSSNMLHQGSKIADESEMEQFLTWLDKMEHEVLGLPRPDAIIYFSVDPEERIKMLQHAQDKKENVMDIAETNLEHQQQTDAAAKRVVQQLNNWHEIDCMLAGEIRSRDSIHDEVYSLVKALL